MNKGGRKEIHRARELLIEAEAIIRELSTDEQDKFDNLPEGLQIAESGARLENTASELDGTADEIEGCSYTLDCIVDGHI